VDRISEGHVIGGGGRPIKYYKRGGRISAKGAIMGRGLESLCLDLTHQQMGGSRPFVPVIYLGDTERGEKKPGIARSLGLLNGWGTRWLINLGANSTTPQQMHQTMTGRALSLKQVREKGKKRMD